MNLLCKSSSIIRERGVWQEKGRYQNCRWHRRTTRVLAMASVIELERTSRSLLVRRLHSISVLDCYCSSLFSVYKQSY